MISTYAIADQVVREKLPSVRPGFSEFDVALTRNALLDLINLSEETDFIDKVVQNRLYAQHARHLFSKIWPFFYGWTEELCLRLDAA